MTRYYTINGDARPKRQRNSNALTMAALIFTLCVSTLFGKWVVDGWNKYLHDAAQVERMR